jgi:RPA family protein
MSTSRGREVAYRLFATEYDDADFEYTESDEERAPNYVVTPTGARANRAFVAGVLTEVTPVGDEEVLRARVADPTGAFVLYAGQYQPEALAVIEETEPPAFLAVTGKARTFQPEDGDRTFTSLRPETITHVDSDVRDHHVVTAAERTIERVDTAALALQSGLTGDALRGALEKAGLDAGRADGLALALEHYDPSPAYLDALRERAIQAVAVVADEREEVDALDLAPDANPEDRRPDDLSTEFASIEGPLEPPADAGEPADEKSVTASMATGGGSETAGDTATTADASSDEEGASEEATGQDGSAETEPASAAEDGETTEASAGDTGEPTAEASADDSAEETAEAPVVDSADLTQEAAVDDTADPTEETAASGVAPGTMEETAGDDVESTEAPDSDAAEESANDGSAESAEEPADDGAESAEASAEEPPTIDSTADAETGASTGDSEESSDDVGGFELGEEEREEVESEFPTDFETGNDVDEAGEAGIDVPDPDELAEAEGEADAGMESSDAPTEAESDAEDGSSNAMSAETTAADTTEGDEEAAADETLDDRVLERMEALDEGDGVERGTLIAAVADETGADPDAVDDAIDDALMDGRCYAPGDDTLKPI